MNETLPQNTTGLWTFDQQREDRYTVPSPSELTEVWRLHHASSEHIDLEEKVFGSCELPKSTPSVVVALDLCEVVRTTAVSLAKIRGGSLEHILSNENGDNSDYSAAFNGWEGPQFANYITTLAQELMHYDHVEPTLFQEATAAFIQRWRKNDAYVIADTSTLPGCEISTVKFLAEYYPGCFQGILLPRNHDGKGPITKAVALRSALDQIESKTQHSFENIPVVMIEDTPHHANSFVEMFTDVQVFMPEYDWNRAAENKQGIHRISQSLGPIDAFIAADEYLRSRGIVE